MRRLLVLVTAILLMLVGLAVPRPVTALSCIALSDIVARTDVIVRGRITAIPQSGVLELAVTREYKGGSAQGTLMAEVTGVGQGQRMDWSREPKVGDELIIGLTRRGDALTNQACGLFVQLEPGQEPNGEVQRLIGQGQPIAGGTDPTPVQAAPAVTAQPEKPAPAPSAVGQPEKPAPAAPAQSDRASAAAVGGGLLVIAAAVWLVWGISHRTR